MNHFSPASLCQTVLNYPESEDFKKDFSLRNNFKFECLFCKQTFERISVYLQHITKHDMKQMHKCTICRKIVLEDYRFREHLFQKHRDIIQLPEVTTKSEVNNNQKAEMENFYQRQYPYYQNFPQMPAPILNNYSIIKPEPVTHPANNMASKQHQYPKPTETYENAKPFTCEHCGETFWSANELTAHSKLHADNKKVFSCDLCGKSYTQSSSLGFHKRKVHGNAKSEPRVQVHDPLDAIYTCHKCHKQFSRPTSLKQHYLVHKDIKPYKCDQCNDSFNASNQLMLHQMKHLNKEPFKCCYCDKEFAISDHHKRHLRSHTKEKPFKCDQCGRAFSQSNTLTQHQRIHNQSRPYSCVFCSKTFSVLNYLNNHLRICKESPTSQASLYDAAIKESKIS